MNYERNSGANIFITPCPASVLSVSQWLARSIVEKEEMAQ